MTEEHKQEEREWKTKTTRELIMLRCLMFTTYLHAFNVDDRLTKYVRQVIAYPAKHNLYELLAVRRFFYLLDKYQFKASKFKKFVKCYETLKFSGINERRRYKLTPIQCFQYANIYGFVDNQGRRLTRDVYIFVPRKFSKTTSTAGMAVFELFCGEYNAQAYCAANSYKQAKILFDEIRKILKSIDPGQRHFKINREKVTWDDGRKESFCQCLASNSDTQDGLFASLVIMDEYSQAKDTAGHNGADLKNTLTTSMGPRKEPLTVVITTASSVIDGPCAREIAGVKKVLKGMIINDRVFASLFMPDVDDAEDNPATWAKVQPHMGITVEPDFYEEEYKKALLSSDSMLAFRTKLLNIFAVDETTSWISLKFIKEHSIDKDITSLQNEYPDAMCAIDLSESDDFSAVTFGIYDYEKKSFFFHTKYFFPRGALEKHENRRLYEIWAEQGYLTLTEGDVIDYEVIANYILDTNKYVRVLNIGYDSWKSTELINILAACLGADAPYVLKSVSQTYGNFNAPVESFEHGIKTGKIKINRNPINDYCFANAVIDVDNMDNKKPIKRGSGTGKGKTNKNKIDGVITKLMCMRLFIDCIR